MAVTTTETRTGYWIQEWSGIVNLVIKRRTIMFRYLQVCALLSASVVAGFVPSLKAGEWDKRTVITLNQRVDVEDVVLPPGEYVLKLLDSSSTRQIVEIFNHDETHLVGTMLAVPAYREEPAADTTFTFYEVPAGHLPAIHTWFYPGDNMGVEFTFPKGTAAE
jgi:hypothetical protein